MSISVERLLKYLDARDALGEKATARPWRRVPRQALWKPDSHLARDAANTFDTATAEVRAVLDSHWWVWREEGYWNCEGCNEHTENKHQIHPAPCSVVLETLERWAPHVEAYERSRDA